CHSRTIPRSASGCCRTSGQDTSIIHASHYLIEDCFLELLTKPSPKGGRPPCDDRLPGGDPLRAQDRPGLGGPAPAVRLLGHDLLAAAAGLAPGGRVAPAAR